MGRKKYKKLRRSLRGKEKRPKGQSRYNYHHRVPKAQGGKSKDTVKVSKKMHQAWHTLFDGRMKPREIAEIINETWLDPRYKFVVERRDEE